MSLLLAYHPLGKKALHPCVQSAEAVMKPLAGEPSFEPFVWLGTVRGSSQGLFYSLMVTLEVGNT